MGVQGLWGILESTAQPVTPHSLRGKVLAIDVSIWLHQAVKGFRDKDGNPLPNAHLLGLFHRICNLLHSGIRPVFVFDGGVPALKRQTLAGRRQKKVDAASKSESARRKLLSNYLQSHVQQEAKKALPPSLRMATKIRTLATTSSPDKKRSSPQKKYGEDEDYELKELRQKLDEYDEEEDWIQSSEESSGSEDFDERSSRNYADDFSTITSAHFDSLDLEKQHEILFQMQESKKTNSWNKMAEMPREAGEFSSFQMDRLLKRRYLQKKILSVQKEMGQRHIHVQNLDELSLYEAEFGTEPQVVGSKDKGALFLKPKPVVSGKSSDEGTVKPTTNPDLGKVVEQVKKSEDSSPQTGPSRRRYFDEEGADIQLALELSLKSAVGKTVKGEDEDLERAIQMSMENEDTSTVTTPDRQATTPKKTVTQSTQRRRRSSPKTELENTTAEKPFEQKIADEMSTQCYKFLGWVGFNDKVVPSPSSPVKSSRNISPGTTSLSLLTPSSTSTSAVCPASVNIPPTYDVTTSGSEDDDDFEEVVEETIPVSKPDALTSSLRPTSAEVREAVKRDNSILPGIKIRITPQGDLGEDLFADIFSAVIAETKPKAEPNDEVAKAEAPKIESRGGNSIVCAIGEEVELEEVGASSSQEFIQETNNIKADGQGQTGNAEPTKISQSWSQDEHEDNSPVAFSHRNLNLEKSDQNDFDEGQVHLEVEAGIEQNGSHSEAETDTPVTARKQTEESCSDEDMEDFASVPDSRQASQPASSQIRMITMDFMQQQERLLSEKGVLRGEIGSQERISTSITDQMYLEGQELLSLFGIPFVVSPMEAEAQCAFLDAACLTDGTITDDSDIWLFGALRVYKNYFAHGDKHVQFFQYADVVRKLHLDREKLVLIAMLCGSDYTNGIEGVGPVTALEILGDEGFQGSSTLDILRNFYSWWSSVQELDSDEEVQPKWREKWRKLRIRPGFPSTLVYDAYLSPTVDTSTEQFRCGTPDLDALRQYAKNKFGWTHSRTDSVLGPALKNFECQAAEIKRQTTLDSFLSRNNDRSSSPSSPFLGQSKRLRKAVQKLKKQNLPKAAPAEVDLSSSDSEEEKPGTSQKTSETPLRGKRKAKNQKSVGTKKQRRSKQGNTEDAELDGNVKVRGQPRIPKGSGADIPQRARSIETRQLNKAKAIQVLKQGKDSK